MLFCKALVCFTATGCGFGACCLAAKCSGSHCGGGGCCWHWMQCHPPPDSSTAENQPCSTAQCCKLCPADNKLGALLGRRHETDTPTRTWCSQLLPSPGCIGDKDIKQTCFCQSLHCVVPQNWLPLLWRSHVHAIAQVCGATGTRAGLFGDVELKLGGSCMKGLCFGEWQHVNYALCLHCVSSRVGCQGLLRKHCAVWSCLLWALQAACLSWLTCCLGVTIACVAQHAFSCTF